MDKKLFVAWQDFKRRWHTVGQLARDHDKYEFVFTEGARPFESILKNLFQVEPGSRYRFTELIPLFRNRLLNPQRPDSEKLLSWVGAASTNDEFELLSKYGVIPGTDSVLLYQGASVNDGLFSVEFFVHGIRHMHPDAQNWTSKAAVGSNLLPMIDLQNEADLNAIALRAENGNLLVGYVPAFHATGLVDILRDASSSKKLEIRVLRCNFDAPAQLRLYCRLTLELPQGASLPSNVEARPYVKTSSHSPVGLIEHTIPAAKFAGIKTVS